MPLVPNASPVILVFWNITALAAVLGSFVVLWVAIGRSRRGTPALNAALAFAVLLCAEAAALNGLSVFGLVGRGGLLVAHLVLIGAVSSALAVGHRQGRPVAPHLPRPRTWWAVGVLVPLVVASAVRYAPNSGDAMTYHLARVAHWIQNGSVAPYPSLSLRQTVMMPGAEYLIASLVGVAGSDHLAALPQFASWLIVAAAAPSLARLWGAPSRWCWLAAPAVMATPMVVLQASSTQNDLVAAATAVAVVAASLPLLHPRRAPESGHIILFGLACAAAGLVKATAVMAASPFAIVAVVTLVQSRAGRSRVPAILIAMALLATLVVPEAARRQTLTRTRSADFVYTAADGWLERIANQGRGIAHHFSVPFVVGRSSDFARTASRMPSRAHEDYAGNPLQLVLIGTLLGLILFRWRRLERRTRLGAVCWIAGWIAIHAIMRDNLYLARLQVPWFALFPVLGGAVSGLKPDSGRAVAVVTSVVLVLNGAWIAAHNELRPPLKAAVGPRERHYFLNGSVVMGQQEEALRIARQAGCRRIGLFMGESGFDYPISRAAMAAGMSTRHVLSDDGWACVIYEERLSWATWKLPRPQVALDASAWSVAAIGPGGPFVYIRRYGP
jgi:hypothetical protein